MMRYPSVSDSPSREFTLSSFDNVVAVLVVVVVVVVVVAVVVVERACLSLLVLILPLRLLFLSPLSLRGNRLSFLSFIIVSLWGPC